MTPDWVIDSLALGISLSGTAMVWSFVARGFVFCSAIEELGGKRQTIWRIATLIMGVIGTAVAGVPLWFLLRLVEAG